MKNQANTLILLENNRVPSRHTHTHTQTPYNLPSLNEIITAHLTDFRGIHSKTPVKI